MVFCTCLCLKKNAIQLMPYSTLCRSMISSPSNSSRLPIPCYARLYSNASAPLSLLRRNPHVSPSPLTRSPLLRHESSQYPMTLLDRSSRQWRFMSVKRSIKAPSDTITNNANGFNYEINDVTPIERLTPSSPHIQHYIQQSLNLASSSPPIETPSTTTPHFDTTALKTLVKNGRLRDALALVLSSEPTHKGILDYPPKDRRLFFNSLGCLSPSELATLLEPWIQQQQQQQQQQMEDFVYNKRLKQLLKCLGSNLSMDLVGNLVRCYPLDVSLQTTLFHRFVKSYMSNQQLDDGRGTMQLDDLLDYLDPLLNNNMEKTSGIIRNRLYNIALNSCLKLGYWDHVDKVLTHMESSGCSLDVASYNMLIRSRLDHGDMDAAKALYEQLANLPSASVASATTATFNTFINYACQQHLWNDMTLWLDRLLDQSDQQPNPVTLRILTAALTDHIDQPSVLDAFQRVAMLVPVTSFELEMTVNTSIVQLLRHRQTDLALQLLYKLFDRSASMDAYPLTVNSYNIFIHALTQKGDTVMAEQLFISMRDQQVHNHGGTETPTTTTTAAAAILPPQPDIVSYTTLIHGYIRSANGYDMDIGRISALYKELMDRGLETNVVLQSVILYAMVKSGFQDIKECVKLFESMVEEDEVDHSNEKGVATILRNEYIRGKPQWNFDNDIGSNSNLSTRQRGMEPKMSRMTIYNMMMDGYFLHQYNEQRHRDHHHHHNNNNNLTTSSIDINRTNRRNRHIPPEPLALLNRAIEKGLPLTTATLNIWVRGLALFNHDIQAAESMVKWMSLTHGVELNERTIYYLVQAAMAQDRRDKARKWISFYEGMDRTIQGTGLLYFKDMVIKS